MFGGGASFRSFSTTATTFKSVVIVGAARTPFGSFRKTLSSVPGQRLGALAIEEAVKRSGCQKEDVDEVYMGCVLSAGMGQAPDRQAALLAGLPQSVPCTLVNKVCASGMKSIMMASQALSLGQTNVAVAGGFESMSRVPFYLERGDTRYGGLTLDDGLIRDGLTDVYHKFHMGMCGENTAKKLSISREEQDEYGIASYQRTAAAYQEGKIQPELFEVSIAQKPGTKDPIILKEDEEYRNVNLEKFKKLKPAFDRENGTVTAGNASTLSDGGAAVVLMTEEEAKARGLKPLARIVEYADAAMAPIDFPLAPSVANDKILKKVGMNARDVDLWEINEAFSVVVLANMKLQELDHSKVNIHGGAVSIGHPLGASGTRIVVHLAHVLKEGQRGIASICNGGGGASAIMLEKL